MLHTDLEILVFSRSPDQSRRIKKKILSQRDNSATS
jgi:hypothetical protein